MRLTALFVLLLPAISVSAQSQNAKKQTEAIERAADALAADMQAKMSPDERWAFNQHVEHNVVTEMQATAATCGTKLEFTNEPKFTDRTVFVARGTTAKQLGCVQKSYPFVKASPQ